MRKVAPFSAYGAIASLKFPDAALLIEYLGAMVALILILSGTQNKNLDIKFPDISYTHLLKCSSCFSINSKTFA